MRSKNLIFLSLLATALISSAAISLVTAEPDVSSATAPPFDPKATPPPNDDVDTNMPIITPDDGTYHILDNQTSINGNPEPGDAQDLLIAPAPQGAEVANDYTIPIAIGAAIAVAAGVGAVATVYYRKQAVKEDN